MNSTIPETNIKRSFLLSSKYPLKILGGTIPDPFLIKLTTVLH